MIEDIVKELGFLTLGTRFKRIGEALQAQTQALLAEHGIDMPAAHFPLLAALDRTQVPAVPMAPPQGVDQRPVPRVGERGRR